jgi:acylphosphatase
MPRQKRTGNAIPAGNIREVRLVSQHERIIRALVTGRVQGVGFRAFVEAEATRRGLSGWVRNRRDGSVEAVFAGSADVVDDMLSACRRGPRSGRVDDVRIETVTEAVDGFRVLPTV